MKKSRLLSITLASTAVLVTSAVVPALCINTSLNNGLKVSTLNNNISNGEYKPLTIKEECLNSCTIVSNIHHKDYWAKSNGVDAKTDKINSDYLLEGTSLTDMRTACAWYTKKCTSETKPLEHAMDDPDDNNNVTIKSGTTDGLSWTVPNVGVEYEKESQTFLKNNSIRIWYDSTDPSKQTKNITFTSTQCGSKLYFLVSAANLTGDSALLHVKCNYSDGTSSKDLTFTINDWATVPSTELKCAQFYRSIGEGYNKEGKCEINNHKIDTSQDYYLSQCAVQLEPTKVLKDITISCDSTTTTKHETNNMVFTIYGVSCLTTDVPKPTGLTAGTTTKTGVTLSWTPSTEEIVAGYKLDVAEDEQFLTYVDKLHDIQIANTRETKSYTLTSGLEPNKTYYARIRSINAAGEQSQHSDVITFKTKDTDATKIEVSELIPSVEIGNAHSFKVNVVGETISGKTYNPEDQTIVFDLTDDQKKYITTKYNETSKVYEVTVDKSGKDQRINFHSNATSTVKSYVDLTVTPKAPTAVTTTDVADTDFNVVLTPVSDADSHKISVLENGNPIQGWDKKLISKGITTVNVPNLKENTNYTVRVWSVSNNAESATYTETSTTTKYTEIPTPYADHEGIKSNKIKFNWNKIHDADNYQVKAYTKDAGGVEHSLINPEIQETTDLFYEVDVSKLAKGENVYFKVQGMKNGIAKGWSSEAIFQIPIPKASLPAWAIGLIAAGSAGVLATAIGVPVGLKRKKQKSKKEENNKK